MTFDTILYQYIMQHLHQISYSKCLQSKLNQCLYGYSKRKNADSITKSKILNIILLYTLYDIWATQQTLDTTVC